MSKFIKENFVLLVGLTLPVLLMAGFLVASNLPDRSDPPKHDLIFATNDFQPGAGNLPVAVRLMVKNGVLKAQYTRLGNGRGGGGYGAGWKKLYRYEAGTKTVRELALGVPSDVDAITTMREDTVEATAALKLDTSSRAPDGYELSLGNTRGGGGIFNELFWSSYSNEARLRKGSTSVPLRIGTQPYLYAGNVEFIGWVVGQN